MVNILLLFYSQEIKYLFGVNWGCSLAGFGITANSTKLLDQSPLVSSGPIVKASDNIGCSLVAKEKKKWWNWGSQAEEKSNIYANKILLVQRGGCSKCFIFHVTNLI